jgi:hypothetical protein
VWQNVVLTEKTPLPTFIVFMKNLAYGEESRKRVPKALTLP